MDRILLGSECFFYEKIPAIEGIVFASSTTLQKEFSNHGIKNLEGYKGVKVETIIAYDLAEVKLKQ